MVAVQVGGFHQSLVIMTTVLPPKKLLQANHLMSLFSPWIMPFQWYTWGRYVLQIFLLICFLFLLQFYLLPHASINTWRKNETVERFILLSFCGFDFFFFRFFVHQPPTVLRPSENHSEQEGVEIAVTKLLLKSYYDIVRKNVEDFVPKAIMHFLVSFATSFLAL